MSERQFKTFFLVASILLVISLIVWLVPSVFLGSISGRLDFLQLKGNLTEAEEQTVTDLTWSQIWWETNQATLFNPVAIVLFVVSMMILIYGAISKVGW